MPPVFRPRLDILPPPQRRLWEELGATPSHFTLYGGTALALRLGHRQSVDFDFFSAHTLDTAELQRTIPYLRDARVDQFLPNTLTCSVDRDGPVRVSFFGTLDIQEPLREPDIVPPGVAIASLEDIGATKMRTVQMRAAARDYLDIAALLESGFALRSMLEWAEKMYGKNFNAIVTLKALSYFGDGDLVSLPADVRKKLTAAAGGLR